MLPNVRPSSDVAITASEAKEKVELPEIVDILAAWAWRAYQKKRKSVPCTKEKRDN